MPNKTNSDDIPNAAFWIDITKAMGRLEKGQETTENRLREISQNQVAQSDKLTELTAISSLLERNTEDITAVENRVSRVEQVVDDIKLKLSEQKGWLTAVVATAGFVLSLFEILKDKIFSH